MIWRLSLFEFSRPVRRACMLARGPFLVLSCLASLRVSVGARILQPLRPQGNWHRTESRGAIDCGTATAVRTRHHMAGSRVRRDLRRPSEARLSNRSWKLSGRCCFSPQGLSPELPRGLGTAIARSLRSDQRSEKRSLSSCRCRTSKHAQHAPIRRAHASVILASLG